MTSSYRIAKNTFVLPTSADNALMPFWGIEQQNQYFTLQKSQEPGNIIFKNVFSTIKNLLDAKQPPYRILFHKDLESVCLQIAISESREAIESAWDWIKINMLPELENISSSFAKEEYVVKKVNAIVSETATNSDADELIQDNNIRNASRTFKKTFDVPATERLVNYYSCSCNSRQGWMYISENFVGFYSYLLGFELKILIELKEVKDIIKEPIRKLFRHSLRIITKDSKEYLFTNMFKRDEVYDLLIQLASDSIQRLLKSTTSKALKDSTTNAINHSPISRESKPEDGDTLISPSSRTNNPLKTILQHRKQNERFRQLFRLPEEEQLIDSINVTYYFQSTTAKATVEKIKHLGILYLSQNFLCFGSSNDTAVLASDMDQSPCSVILPLYTITRLERINNDTYRSELILTIWHKMTHNFKVDVDKITSERFCDSLKNGLQVNVERMKRHLRRFLTTCQSENLLQTVDGPIHIDKIESGLGARFGYPSDMSHAKYEQKLNVWISYFEENSRNLTMVRQPIFSKMIRSGIPDELRGEVWEMSSGSMYLRFDQQGLYQQILKEHENDTSFAIEEIEKDLHRSLPEYPAYQTKEGIDRLRRVLIAYSWKNPEIGYCQSMNIVTSCLLIYMTEEQAFWILHALVDYLCPGYYSSSMYGALLDQVVLESLVKIHIPKLSTYLDERNLQLSVICLPWFLTLFFNSMPIAFAFRILDCFFLEGPRILFQIALAILKRHEKQLLTVDDESGLLMIMKEFFASLITPADDVSLEQHEANNSKIFNSLMKSAYADFRRVTSTKIAALRKESELKIIGSVENFTKRNALRSIKSTANFGSDEISLIYDYFFGALYYANKQHDKDSTPEMDLVAFTKMLESMTTWAKLSSRDDYQDSIQHSEDFVLLDEVLKSFIRRLFNYFKSDDLTGITLTDCVSKLDELLRGDILSKASFYFALYDEDKDGKLMNTDLHSITAEMFLLMNLLNVDFNKWETICSFLALTVEESSTKEAADRLLNKIQDSEQLPVPGLGKINATYFVAHINKIHNALFELDIPSIKLTLPSFRAVLLTEDRLVQLIQTDIPRSFRLQKGTDEAQKGLGLEILETLILEGKKLAVTTNLARSNQQLLLPPPPSARRRLSSASIPPPIPTRSPRSPISTSTMSTHNNNNETHLEDDDYELL